MTILQRIRKRLDQADKIFDDLQGQKEKPEKPTDIFQEIFDSMERGVKKLFSSVSEASKPPDRGEQTQPLIPERLARYLCSCSDAQLKAIIDEIESILRERHSA